MYESVVQAAAARWNVPMAWILAVIGTESGDVRTFQFRQLSAPTWEPNAGEYSWGPMQILESTARGLGYTGPAVDLAKPEVSIPLAVELLADLRRRFGEDFRRIYSAYNSGNPDRWLSSDEVRRNVERAVTWLKHVQPRALSVGMVAAVVVVALGLLWKGAGR